MHEFSLAQSMLEVAVSEAQRVGAHHITRLKCRVGDLRQIDGQLLRDAFEVVREGTVCEGAELDVEKVRARAHCSRCERDFEVCDGDWVCAQCNGLAQLLEGGDELEIISLEAEVDS